MLTSSFLRIFVIVFGAIFAARISSALLMSRSTKSLNNGLYDTISDSSSALWQVVII